MWCANERRPGDHWGLLGPRREGRVCKAGIGFRTAFLLCLEDSVPPNTEISQANESFEVQIQQGSLNRVVLEFQILRLTFYELSVLLGSGYPEGSWGG